MAQAPKQRNLAPGESEASAARAAERARDRAAQADPDDRPILFLDVDGVISLYGFRPKDPPPGRFHWIDGVAHCIGEGCGILIARLMEHFEVVWATGWEEKANEYLPFLLDLPLTELPVLTFDGRAVFGEAHWKVDAIDEYAGERPAAWIDDALDQRCQDWARSRSAPTLLVQTDTSVGIREDDVKTLLDWADEVAP